MIPVDEPMVLLLDGSTNHGTHYCAVYISLIDSDNISRVFLLAMSPFKNEADLTHGEFMNILSATCHTFWRTLNEIAVLVGDNCSVNQVIARWLMVPLVGCASHKFNLAVNAYLEDYADIVDPVQAIMIKAPDLLQRDNTTMANARVLFEGVVELYPSMVSYLAADAAIVARPVFESAVIKLQEGLSSDLTESENDELARLGFAHSVVVCANEGAVQTCDSARIPLAQRIMEDTKRRRVAPTADLVYRQVMNIMPTSNVVERLFS
ncbi:hypothetical protein ACHHYP_03592 [Achlya hypogyna]|uniref:Uncharacterized protein n=1 Tax=Achlya hypogyna TaxID=1202772 RepID=A0A1V9ZR74_ACHHY|nr:hypothetical protein ACHHYP_03592 [Achlya hypogyna]